MKRFIFLFVLLFFTAYSITLSNVTKTRAAATSGTNTPAASQTPIAVISPSFTPVFVPTATLAPINLTSGSINNKLEAFIKVPSGTIPKPYVILSGYKAYSGASGPVSINGTLQDKNFSCPVSPCELEIPTSGLIKFRAYDSNGNSSDEVRASLLVTALANGGYAVSITSLNKHTVFTDACASIWQNVESVPPSWARFPQDPADLNTEKRLDYLASRLISAGVVDTKDCPGGGINYNAPNACGIGKVKEQMTAWQNLYDINFWLAARDEHIPPVLLKTLIEIESQFWPTTHRLFLDEIGLGQVNQLGIDVVLRTNPDLYRNVCVSTLYNCDQPYISLSGLDRALIRGAFVQSLDAACPTCQYGVDLNKAAQSIPTIAKILYANCIQAKSILTLHEVTADYEDSWKFTLVSYHSGFGCLQSAIENAAVKDTVIDWETVSNELNCPGAVDYIDKFWTSLYSFDANLLTQPVELPSIQLQTPTPVIPTPTHAPVVSSARILVKIFVDRNGDGIRQDDEALDNVLVILELQNGASYTQVSKNGIAIFDLTGTQIGVKGKVSLPGFYRSAPIQVPESGDYPITFIFTQPILPTQFP